METNIIEIEGKNVKEGVIINHYPGPGSVVGTIFGRKSGVKKELKEYADKGYKYIYFVFSKIHFANVAIRMSPKILIWMLIYCAYGVQNVMN